MLIGVTRLTCSMGAPLCFPRHAANFKRTARAWYDKIISLTIYLSIHRISIDIFNTDATQV